MKLMYQTCGVAPPLDPITAASLWRLKTDRLLKVDVEIHDEDGNPQIATEDNPANIPVNGDFDEEKQTNGHYVRDYEDASIGFVDDSTDLKTDDLRGCVVNIPGLDDSVWQNTTLKIRKKSGVIDPETNEEEAGEIRIHAINGSNQWVEVPLDTDLAPDYYVSTGQYANYDSCWLEGIKDGPITLEVEVVINGGTPILVEKKAMICTENTKAEWQQEVWDDMQLLYDADLSNYEPLADFPANQSNLTNLYNYYGEMYLRDTTAHLWPGIGKLAGATVIGGLRDAEYFFTPLASDLVAGDWGTEGAFELAVEFLDDDLEVVILELKAGGSLTPPSVGRMQYYLMSGAEDIFLDIAWQFKAYYTSGLCALEYSREEGAAQFPITDWRLLDLAVVSDDTGEIALANQNFAEREQRVLIDPTWDALIDGGWAEMYTHMAKNPTPESSSFAEYFTENPKSGGNPILPLNGAMVSDFYDRFEWFTQSILPDWLDLPSEQRSFLAEESVWDLSSNYQAIPSSLYDALNITN